MEKKDIFLLILAVGIIIGYTYALDTPQALEAPLRKQPYNFSSSQFNLIYFSTYLLMTFLQIPLGIYIDRTAMKRTLILMLLFLFISQAVISVMFQFRPQGYILMILFMRSIFGLCGEGLLTAQCVIMTTYAKNQYQMLAGLSLALPFVFDAINSLITTVVYDLTNNLPLVWYIGCGVCLLSLACGFQMNRSMIKQQNSAQIQNSQKISTIKDFIKEMKLLGKEFWMLNFFVFFTQFSLGGFNDNLNQLILERFSIKYTLVGKLLLIPFMGLAIFIFIIGRMIKKKPQIRRINTLCSSLLYLFAQICLYLLPNTKNPSFLEYLVIIFFLFSMSWNFAVYFSCLLPAVSFVVKQNMLGTAFGAQGSFIGLSQCIAPLLFILIIDSNPVLSISYHTLSGFGIVLAALPVIFAIWINYWDNYKILDGYYSDIQKNKTKNQNQHQNPQKNIELNQLLLLKKP